MQRHRQQKANAQNPQKRGLRHLIAVDINDAAAGTNGIIDDPLGQFQRQVQHGKQGRGHGQQDQLVAFGVFPDKAEERAFYGKNPNK